MKRFLFLGCLALMGSSALWGQSDLSLDEAGVLYLPGNVPVKVTAVIKAMTAVFTQRNFQTVAGYLSPGQTVEVLGVAPDGYILRGSYRNNTITGWIHPQDLPTGFDPRIFDAAKKTQERRDAIAAAIANKTVVTGMTPEEVQQAVGRPEQTATKTDARGSTVTWIFTTYKEEPQYSYALDGFGRAVLQTYYVKIPIGQMIIGFGNGVVSTIDQHETDPNSPGVVTN